MLYKLLNFCLQFWTLVLCGFNILVIVTIIAAITIGLPVFIISKIKERI